MTSKSNPIRVLVVEDSRSYRELLVNILQSSPDLQVVGTAHNGAEAIRLVHRLQPDVVTMDIYMPEVDGYEATRRIMEEMPRPIVMVSGSLNKNEHKLTFDAIKAGALTVLGKPTINDPPEVFENLISQVRLLSEVRVVRHWTKSTKTDHIPLGNTRSNIQSDQLSKNGNYKIQIVAIASSTGGPGALASTLGPLPETFPAPILLVQHVTVGFGEGLAKWLNGQTALNVRIAKHAEVPKPGDVLVAPDDYHMTINNMGLVSLNQNPPIHGLRPAADHLFHSVATTYGKSAVGIILTGMGSDGAEGLRAMRDFGARTIAQNEETCVVFGMPAVAIKLGAAEQIKPLPQIAKALMDLVQE